MIFYKMLMMFKIKSIKFCKEIIMKKNIKKLKKESIKKNIKNQNKKENQN